MLTWVECHNLALHQEALHEGAEHSLITSQAGLQAASKDSTMADTAHSFCLQAPIMSSNQFTDPLPLWWWWSRAEIA